VADRANALAAGIDDFLVGTLDVGERLDVERDLLHHRGVEVGGASAHQHDLVVVAGVARQKRDAPVGRAVR